MGDQSLEHGHPSGSVKSYLEWLCPDSIEEVPSEPEVAPSFEKSERDVFGRSHSRGESSPKETASLDELKKSAGDLQEKVEDLAGDIIVAVNMFQFKSPVFLDIEALVFNDPSAPSSIVGYFDGACLTDFEIGNPLESSGPDLPCLIRFGLKAPENAKGVLSVFSIDIGNIVYPPVLLVNSGFFACPVLEVTLRMESLEGLELLLNGGEVILVNDQELPAVSVAQVKGGAAGKEAIEADAQGKPGESFFEPLCKPVESLELTVLFAGILPGVLDEFRHKGEGESVWGHELCLEHLVVVDRLGSVSPGETVRAMSLVEGNGPRPIDSHNIVDAPKSPAREHLLSDEGFGHPGNGLLSLLRREPEVEIIKGITMGKGVDTEKDLELFPGGLILSELVCDLSSGSESQQEHENSCKAKRCKRVVDLPLVSRIGCASKNLLETTEEMLHRLDENSDQSFLLLLSAVRGRIHGSEIKNEIVFQCGLLHPTGTPVEREEIIFSLERKPSRFLILSRFTVRRKINRYCCGGENPPATRLASTHIRAISNLPHGTCLSLV